MPPSVRSALINEETASPASRSESPKDDKEDAKDIEVQCGSGESRYSGSGTADDPYVVDWHPDDPENPYNWSETRRWVYTFQVSRGRSGVHIFADHRSCQSSLLPHGCRHSAVVHIVLVCIDLPLTYT